MTANAIAKLPGPNPIPTTLLARLKRFDEVIETLREQCETIRPPSIAGINQLWEDCQRAFAKDAVKNPLPAKNKYEFMAYLQTRTSWVQKIAVEEHHKAGWDAYNDLLEILIPAVKKILDAREKALANEAAHYGIFAPVEPDGLSTSLAALLAELKNGREEIERVQAAPPSTLHLPSVAHIPFIKNIVAAAPSTKSKK